MTRPFSRRAAERAQSFGRHGLKPEAMLAKLWRLSRVHAGNSRPHWLIRRGQSKSWGRWVNERSRPVRWRRAGVVTVPEPAGSIRPSLSPGMRGRSPRNSMTRSGSLDRDGRPSLFTTEAFGMKRSGLPKTHCRPLGKSASGPWLLLFRLAGAIAALSWDSRTKPAASLIAYSVKRLRACTRGGTRHPIRADRQCRDSTGGRVATTRL